MQWYHKQKPLDVIRRIVHKHIDDKNIEAFVFGSQAMGIATKSSDRDIGLRAKNNQKIPFRIITRLSGAFDETPYMVDVVDFSTVDDRFKKVALKKTIPL